MKKLFILSLAALLALASGSVYAQAPAPAPVLDFKASGYFALVNYWFRNFSPAIFTPGQSDKSISQTTLRGRLMFNANMGKELSGTIYFEMDGSTYGASPGSLDAATLQRNSLTYWSADRTAVEIKWLYFDVAVPVVPVPINLRIGQQPFGPRFPFFSGDDSGITANIDLSPVKLAAYWMKPVEGKIYSADDDDMYGLKGQVNLGTVTVGGYGVNFNMNTYPMWVKRTGAAGAVTVNDYIQGTQAANFWYLGAFADGKFGPVTANFDFVYDTGKVKSTLTPAAPDNKYNGWFGLLNLDYPWEQFNFGLGGFYASGDNKNDTTKHKGYVSPPLSEGCGPWGEALFYAGNPLDPIGNFGITFSPVFYTFANAGLGGSWYAKAYVKAKVTPAYTVTGRLYYIGDTTKNGDTWGSAKDGAVFQDNRTIAWEFDLFNTFQIYKNLKMNVVGALMPLGKAMYWQPVAGVNTKPHLPWWFSWDLTYNF